MPSSEEFVHRFEAGARAVSAVVARVADVTQALAYTVDLCVRKEACELLGSGCEQPLSIAAERLCDEKRQKVMAAPNLSDDHWTALKQGCERRGIVLTDRSLRGHLYGIDIGLTLADYGIAETGTLVIDSRSESVRLASMISEIQVALLPVSRIRATADELAFELKGLMASPAGYLAFITGASRTADIERVLAIGVHGPLALHILLMEDH